MPEWPVRPIPRRYGARCMNRMHRLVTVGAVAIVTLAGCSSSAEETFIPVDDAGSTGSTADGAGEVPSTAQLVASYGSGRAEAAAPTPRGTVVVTTIGGTILDEGGERPLDTDWTTGQFRSASLSTDEDVIGIARDSPATMEWYDIESGALLGAHQLESTDVVVQTIAAGTGSPPIALTSGGVVRFAPSTGVTEFVPYPSGTTIAGTTAVVASGLEIVPLTGTGSVWIVSTDEEAVRDLGLGDGVQVADVLGLRFDGLEMTDDVDDLRRLRQSVGLTRAEAAARLGIEAFTLQRVEEGLELPPDPRLMARVYGVSRADLAAAARRVEG